MRVFGLRNSAHAFNPSDYTARHILGIESPPLVVKLSLLKDQLYLKGFCFTLCELHNTVW